MSLVKQLLFTLMIMSCVTVFAAEAPVMDIAEVSSSSAESDGSVDDAVQPESSSAWHSVSNETSTKTQDASKNTGANLARNSTSQNWEPASTAPSKTNTGTIDGRVNRLEQQMANYSQMNLPQQVSDMQQKLAQLQGEIEESQHTLTKLTDQQKLFYQDVSQQLVQLRQGKMQVAPVETATLKKMPLPAEEVQAETEFARAAKKTSITQVDVKPTKTDTDKESNTVSSSATDNTDSDVKVKPSTNNPSPVPPTAEKTTLLSDASTYKKAFRALSLKHYDEAQTQFKNYLSVYPKGHFADNAYFWLGEIDLMHSKYGAAMKQFNTVISGYPKSKKVADAKLKIAMIYAATGKMSLARTEFLQVRKAYPGTTAAQLANIRLQQLASATSVDTE